MNNFDRHLCLWINGWPDWLSPLLTFFSVAMNYLVVKLAFASAFVAMLIRSPRARAAALVAFLAFLIANGSTDLFKHHLPMHRPFQPEALGDLIIMRVGKSDSMGTASAHAANMASLATVMTLMLGRWGWPWIAVAVITGISRVYVGAHFPSQVLLGWTCGFAAGMLTVAAYKIVTRTRRASSDLPS
ncbi:MAG: phosphatase PAP2 family protein [Fimbriimonadaceae bacterium]